MKIIKNITFQGAKAVAKNFQKNFSSNVGET
jgi:hypothetical protein